MRFVLFLYLTITVKRKRTLPFLSKECVRRFVPVPGNIYLLINPIDQIFILITILLGHFQYIKFFNKQVFLV